MGTARVNTLPWGDGAARPWIMHWNLPLLWKFFTIVALCVVFNTQSVAGVCDCGTDCVSSCTAGQYWDSNATACIECPPGYYCAGGNAARVPCTAGTYNSLASQDEEADCLVRPNPCLIDQSHSYSCQSL
ncbi:uncharacterized protein [Diadema antillarum]|uniref:uncharacterized protein n=1 Tax=Diadema antillarum TaxID=105358 RepID=UPI003A88993D